MLTNRVSGLQRTSKLCAYIYNMHILCTSIGFRLDSAIKLHGEIAPIVPPSTSTVDSICEGHILKLLLHLTLLVCDGDVVVRSKIQTFEDSSIHHR